MKSFPIFTIFLVISVICSTHSLEFESAEETTNGYIDQSGEDGKEPLDIDYISGDIGGVVGGTNVGPPQRPSGPGFDTSSIFDHHFGSFFNNNDGFFGIPSFGGFNFDRYKPWWKGPNVCTEREEDVEDSDKNENKEDGENIGFISHFNLNIETCQETNNKHVCKKVTNVEGRKTTVKIIKQCCHGFARVRSVAGNCEKIDLFSISETAEKLGGKSFVRTAIKNELNEMMDSNITVFVPIDTAFADFADGEDSGRSLGVVPLGRNRRQNANEVSRIATKDLILNHIVKGRWVNIEDIDNEEVLKSEYNNSVIRMNVFPKLMFPRRQPEIKGPDFENDDDNYPYLYTANCVPVVKANKLAANGVVHMLNGVLMPVTRNLMEIIRSREDMTILRTILEKTKMEKMLDGSSDDEESKKVEKQFTLFAPTDRAFEKLDPQLKRKLKEGSACAMNILKNHLLDLTFCSAAVAESQAKTTAFNMLGEKMSFERIEKSENDTEKVTNEIDKEDDEPVSSISINGKAKVIETDIMGTNGVIHVIDSLMETQSGLPISSMLGHRNLTVFKKLMDYGNFDDEFDSLNNATYFVPTDEAFENSKMGKYWIDQLENSPQKLKNNQQLKEFLEYHVTQPLVRTCDLKEDMLKTKSGGELRVNLYSTLPSFVNIMNRATVNCARLIHFDDESCGSVVHQVDKILEPPNQSLLEMLQSKEEYSMFLKFMQSANLTSLFESTEESYTLFVPKDDVFREVADWYKEMLKEKNADELADLMQSHIVPDVLCCSGITRSEWPFVRTVETVNKHNLHLNRDRRPKVQNAGITKCDIIAKNGIIHEINDIISVNPNIRPNGPIPTTQTQRIPSGNIYGSFFNFPNFNSFTF